MNALKSATGHPVTHLAFAPDGSAFAAAQPHSGVTLHDRATGQPIRTAGKNNVAAYRGLVFFDGGTRLATSTPKGLELFDLPDMTCFLHHRYARNGLLAADGADIVAAIVAAWATWVERIEVPPRSSADAPTSRAIGTRDAVFEGLSPDGRFVAWVAAAKRIAVGDLRDAKPCRVIAEAQVPGLKAASNASAVTSVRIGPDRVVFAPRSDRFAVRTGKAVLVFDMPSWEVEPEDSATEVPRPHSVLRPVFEVDAPPKWPKGEWYPPVAFTPCGRFLLVRRPLNQVQMWEVASGSMLTQWNWHLDGVASLAVAPDGMTAAAGGRFGRVVVWDLE